MKSVEEMVCRGTGDARTMHRKEGWESKKEAGEKKMDRAQGLELVSTACS